MKYQIYSYEAYQVTDPDQACEEYPLGSWHIVDLHQQGEIEFDLAEDEEKIISELVDAGYFHEKVLCEELVEVVDTSDENFFEIYSVEGEPLYQFRLIES